MNKKEILTRVYLIYFLTCAFCLFIVFKIVIIQYVEGDALREKGNNLTIKYKDIEAVRGNIYDSKGSLLATSLPIYEIRMDLNTPALTDEVFDENIDSLCIMLSNLYHTKSALDYKIELVTARANGARYHLIKRNVRYNELKAIRDFPIFRLGQYKGGFICEQHNIREKPFRVLASRTIGYDREDIVSVGLEGAYNVDLKGVDGKRLVQKLSGGDWKPINNRNEIEPKDGYDIYTTIDINIQDVAENALMNELAKHDADHGCVVVMEVATGEIKAIANLSRTSEGTYFEKYNYAIGESTEPGSTFKLASLMVALEDGFVDLEDSVDTEDGSTRFYENVMYDSHKGGYGTISVQRAFEVSSNVGISKIINDNYSKTPEKFIDRLYQMNLNQLTGIEIKGEGKPIIKNVNDEGWSGITIPWMSIGYEVSQTPLQILTFYNAVANDGKMVKPMFVKEIRDKKKLIKRFETVVLNESICSKNTIQKAQKMLKGVVDNGTAKNLKNADFSIAGKTGTAQIANAKYGYKYKSRKSYQASFCGYFPADNPKYSCIVVVNAPSRNVYYGNLVAGPIFSEIADKIYANSIDIHKKLNTQKHLAHSALPYSKNGNKKDLKKVFQEFNVPIEGREGEADWVITRTKEKSVEFEKRKIVNNLVPNVLGMGLNDALYLLENSGLNVIAKGRGVVKNQSIKPGINTERGQQIVITLS